MPKTVAVPGYNHYLTPLRKVIIDYNPLDQHQAGLRWVVVWHLRMIL